MAKRPSLAAAEALMADLAARENEIRERYDQLVRDRLLDEELTEKLIRHNEVTEGIRELEALVLKTESELKAEWEALKTQLDVKKLLIARYSTYLSEHEYDKRELNRLHQWEEELDRIKEAGFQCKADIKTLEDTLQLLDRLVASSRGTCPACGRPTEPSAASDLEEVRSALRIRRDERAQEIERLRAQYVELEKEIKPLEQIRQRVAIAEARLEELEEARAESVRLKESADRIQVRLKSRSFARRELQAIDELQTQLKMLDYDADHHRQVRERVQSRLQWEIEYRMLERLKSVAGKGESDA